MTINKAIIDVEINTSGAAASLRTLQAQVNAFQSALNKGNLVQGAAAKEYAKNLSAMVNSSGYFTAETTKMRTSAGALDETLRKGKGTIGQYFQSLRKGTAAYSAVSALAQARTAALQTQFVATGAAARGFQDALAIKPLTAFNDAAAVAGQRLAIQRAMFNQATTSMINYGKNVQWAGRQLMVGFTVPLTILGALAAKTFTDLEKQVVSFKKVYGDLFTAPGELEANIEAVKELGMELTKYGIKLSETTKLAAEAAAAGNKNADLINVTREASRLAVLGQLDQQKALESTIAMQTAFGISSKDLADNINFLNMVENQTVLTLNDITDAIPRVAPVIKGLGGDVRDTAVLLAAMKEGGVSAAQGANALKSGLASLINPTNKAVEALSEMGINLNQIIQSNQGDLMGTIRSFSEALNDLDEFSRQKAIEKVFGKYQFARLGALFTNITKEGTQAARVMDLAGMSAKDLADTANKELATIEASPAAKLTASIEKLKIALVPIGEAFAKIVAPIAEIFTRLFQNLNNLPDFVKKIGAIGTVLVGLVIPAGTMFLGLLMNLTGTLLKFGNVFKVAFQGFLKGGFSGMVRAVGESFHYMSLSEIEAALAAEQLGAAGVAVDAALKDQAISAGNARAAIDNLAGAYGRLAVMMREAIPMSSVFAVPGAAMGKAAGAAPAMRSGFKLVRRNRGGSIPYLSGGGTPTVPGVGNTDTVPAMLTPGEFVVNKQATQQNLPLLHAINSGNVQGLNRGGGVATLGRAAYGVPSAGAGPMAWLAQAEAAHQRALGGTASTAQTRRLVTPNVLAENAHFGSPSLTIAQGERLGLIRGSNSKVSFGLELLRAGVPVTALTDDWATVTRKLNQAANRNSNEKISIRQAVEELQLGRDEIFKREVGPAMQRLGIGPDDFTNLMISKLSKMSNQDSRFTDAIFTRARNDAFAELGARVSPTITGLRIPTKTDLQEFVGSQRGLDALQSKAMITDRDIADELKRRGFGYENGKITSVKSGASKRIGESSPYAGSTDIEVLLRNAGGMIPGVQYFNAKMAQRVVQRWMPKPQRARMLEALQGYTTYHRPLGQTASGRRRNPVRGFSIGLVDDALRASGLSEKEVAKIPKHIKQRMSQIEASHIKAEASAKSGWNELANLSPIAKMENETLRNLILSDIKSGKKFANKKALVDQASQSILKNNPKLNKASQSVMAGNHPSNRQEMQFVDLLISQLLGNSKYTKLLSNSDKLYMHGLRGSMRIRLGKKIPGGKKRGEDPLGLWGSKLVTLEDIQKRTGKDLSYYRNEGGPILGGVVNAAKNFYGAVGPTTTKIFDAAMRQWQASSAEVRKNPDMLGALLGRMRPLGSEQRLTRGTTLGLGRGSEFASADEAMILNSIRSGKLDDLIGKEVSMRGPISYTSGGSEIARNAMTSNPDVSRFEFLRAQHKLSREHHFDRLKRIEKLRKQIASGKGATGHYQKQLDDLLKQEAMYPAGQKALGQEIKALAPRGYRNVELRQGFRPEDRGIRVTGGSYLGKPLAEEEFISAGSRARIKSAYIGKDGYPVIELDNVGRAAGARVSGQEIMAEIQQKRAGLSVQRGKGLEDVIFSRDAAGKLNADPFDLLTLLRTNPNITQKDIDNIRKYHGSRIKAGRFGKFDEKLGYKVRDPQASTWTMLDKALQAKIPGFNSGGFMSPTLGGRNIVPGSGNTDTVPAMLTPGEFVINKQATKENLPLLKAINGGSIGEMISGGIQKFAGGGYVVERYDDGGRRAYRVLKNGQIINDGFTTKAAADRHVASLRSQAGRSSRESASEDRAQKRAAARQAKVNAQTRRIQERQDRIQARANKKGMTVDEYNRQREAKAQKVAMGRQAAGMGLSMAAMIPMFAGDPETGKFMGMDSSTAMMSMMGAGTLLTLPAKMAAGIAAISVPLTAFGLAVKNSREELDKVTEAAYQMGINLGGTADRMETVSQATGYIFSGQEARNRLFRFTGQEKKDIYQYAEYFETDRGKKYIEEIKQLTSTERYAKIASEMAFAVADGMDPKDAKAYGMAIAAYAGDAFLKQRIVRDFRAGKYDSTPDTMINLIEKRQVALEKAQQRQGYVSEIGQGGPGAKMARGLFGQTGYNATYGDVVLGGIAGIGAGAAAGAAIGAVTGSAVPVLGNIILGALGALIGGAIGWAASNSTREDMLKNSEYAAMNVGASTQVLKEIANAEARLLELRRKGTITTEEYAKQQAKLDTMKESATVNVQKAVEAIAMGGDIESVVGKVKSQLVLSGYDAGQAEAIARTTDFDTIAKQIYGPEVNMGDLKQDKVRSDIVTSAIAEIFTGLTPENAGQQIAKVTEAWRDYAAHVQNGVIDGVTSQSVKEARIGAIAVGNAMQEAFTMASPEDAITTPEDIIPEDILKRVLAVSEEVQVGKNRQDFYLEGPSGVRLRGITASEASASLTKEDLGTIKQQGLGNVQSRIEEAIKNSLTTPGGDWQKTLGDWMSQDAQGAVTVLEEFKETAIKDKQQFASIFGIDPENQKAIDDTLKKIQAVFEFSQRTDPLTGQALAWRGVSTEAERAGLAIEEWVAANEGSINSLGVSAESLAISITQISDLDALKQIQGGTDEMKMSFAGLTAQLAEAKYNAIALSSATKYMFKLDVTPEQVRQEIDSLFKFASKKTKEYGKQKGIVPNLMKNIFGDSSEEASSYFELVSEGVIDKSKQSLQQYFEEVTGETQVWLNQLNKAGAINKKTGRIKINAQLVTTLFGQEIGNTEQIEKLLSKQFGGMTIDPSYVSIIAQLDPAAYAAAVSALQALQNPATAGYTLSAIEALKEDPDATMTKGNKERYTYFDTTTGTQVVKEWQMPGQKIDPALARGLKGVLNLGSSTASPQLPTGNTGGGSGEKSIPEQIAEMLKQARKMFNALWKLYTQNTDKFKTIIAGPFGPEFLNYLMDQGDKGAKILEGKMSKILALYKKFEKAQTLQLAAQALVAPLTQGFEIRGQKEAFDLQTSLLSDVSEERRDYISEKIDPKELIILEKLRRRKTRRENEGKKLSKEDQRVFFALELKVDATKWQSEYKAALDQLEKVRSGVQETTDDLGFMSKASAMGLSPAFAQNLKDAGFGMELLGKLGAEAIAKIADGLNKLNIAKKIDEIKTSLNDTYNSAKNVLQISKMGIFGDLATELGDLAGSMVGFPLQEVARALIGSKMVVRGLRTEEQKLTDTLDVQEQAAQARLKVIEDSNYYTNVEIDKISDLNNVLQHNIDLESDKKREHEDAIKKYQDEIDAEQETYDKRIKALDTIEKLNESIRQQQQDQLSIAQALTMGDIGAAAQAMQEAQANFAQGQSDAVRDALDAQHDAYVLSMQEKIKAEREAIEGHDEVIAGYQDQIRDNNYKIYDLQQKISASKEKEREQQEKLYKIDLLRTIEQTKQAALSAALVGDFETLGTMKDVLKTQLRAIGKDEAAVNAFFTSIPGAQAAISGAEAVVAKSPQQLMAQQYLTATGQEVGTLFKTWAASPEMQGAKQQLVDILKPTFGDKVTITPDGKLLVDGKEVNQEQYVLAIQKIQESNSTLMTNFFNFLQNDIQSYLQTTKDKMLESVTIVKDLPTLATGIYKAFQGAMDALNGEIKKANDAAKAVGDAIAAAKSSGNNGGGSSDGKDKPAASAPNPVPSQAIPAIDTTKPGKVYTPPKQAASAYKHMGGSIKKFATGSMVPGSGNTDKVPALLTPGEFVVRKTAVQKYGQNLLDSINMGAFGMPTYNIPEPVNSEVSVGNTRTSINAPTYNTYSVNVTVPDTNASPDVIANKVLMRIAETDRMNLRSIRGNR